MTKSKKIALLREAVTAANAAYAAVSELLLNCDPLADGARFERLYDAARSLRLLADEDLSSALMSAAAYKCPHTAALISANID